MTGTPTLTLSEDILACHLAKLLCVTGLLVQFTEAPVPPFPAFLPHCAHLSPVVQPRDQAGSECHRHGCLAGPCSPFSIKDGMGYVQCRALSLACSSPSHEAPLSLSCSVATCRWTCTGLCPLLVCLRGSTPSAVDYCHYIVCPLGHDCWTGLWPPAVPALRRPQISKGRTAATQRRVQGGRGYGQSPPLPALSTHMPLTGPLLQRWCTFLSPDRSSLSGGLAP